MGLIRCENGHLFSEKRYGTICPYCSTAVNIARKKGEDVDGVLRDTTYLEELEVMHPVVGWLVCVEGKMLGKAFELKNGKNFIGRSSQMDVILEGDANVSRDRHAIVTYEPRGREFFAQPGESRELFYVNGQVVLMNVVLKARDIISVGKTDLMFIPFCGADFSWDEIKK